MNPVASIFLGLRLNGRAFVLFGAITFSLSSAFAANTEDFNPGNLDADERVIVGSVRIFEGEEELTSSCRVCFRANLAECFSLDQNGTLHHKRKIGSQSVTSVSCNGKEPDRVPLRNFNFPVDARPGVATYFGAVTVRGSFKERLFTAESVEDRYSDEVSAFHRRHGNRMAVRYVRGLPSISMTPSEAPQWEDEKITAAETAGVVPPKKKNWFIDLGVHPIIATKYNDKTGLQGSVYDPAKNTPGADRDQFAASGAFFIRSGDAPRFLLGGELLYARDRLRMNPGDVNQEFLGYGAVARYYPIGEAGMGAYFVGDFGRTYRKYDSSGFSRSSLNLSATRENGFYFGGGLGGEVRIVPGLSLGLSARSLFDYIAVGAEWMGVRRFLLGIHLFF